VKAPPFAYARAGSLDDALGLLAEAGDEAKLLAGGQSLVPLLVHRVVRPTHLVDVDGLGELTGRTRDGRGLVLGALTRHAELEHAPLEGRERVLSLAAARIGHVPIRARGTLGGSVAHADPAAELPAALLSLDASIVTRSRAGERTIAAEDFFLGPFATSLEPAEAVVSVVVPGAARRGRAAFAELAVRAGDFALASVAATAVVEEGRVSEVRIVLGAIEASPVRATAAEQVLEGGALRDAAIEEAARAAASGCDPVEDASTSASYRRALVARLVRDTVRELRDGAA